MDSLNSIALQIKGNIQRQPNKTAFKVDGYAANYHELDEMAAWIVSQISNFLESNSFDKEKEIRIGVCLHRNRLLIPAIWAICQMGLTYVPLDPETPIDRIEFILKDCNIDLIISEKSLESLFNGRNILFADCLEIPETHLPKETVPPINNQTAYIIYTSGTTGKPKGVPITYESLLCLLNTVKLPDYMNISDKSRILTFGSINFDASILDIFSSLFHAATLILATEQDRRDINSLTKLIINEKVSFATLPPSLVAIMPVFDFPDMDTFTIAGEKMTPELAKLAQGKKYRLINAYGPTENTVMSSMQVVSPDVTCTNIGKTIPNVIGYVLDTDLKQVNKGETGELYLGGKQLTTGYLNNPELNRKLFIPNPFPQDKAQAPTLYKTGDLVRLMPDNSYDFIGRSDSQIKLNGYRVEIEEINHHIEQCEGVVLSLVKLETINNKKALTAYVKLQTNCNVQKIKKALKKFLPQYMIPSQWITVDQFPMTINGKIDSKRLTELYLASNRPSKHENNNSLIAGVIAKIVGTDSIDTESDLIDDLGLTSIQIMQIPLELEFFEIHISVNDIYKYRTIKALSQVHTRPVGYWYNTPEDNKPTLIVVSGYTNFDFLYKPFAQGILNDYSIYVIESYHDHYDAETQTWDDLVNIYLEHIAPLAEKGIFAITGFCLGGELGLHLAEKLHHTLGITPLVVALDSEIDRSRIKEDYIPIRFEKLPDSLNASRSEKDIRLIQTRPDFHYDGPVTSILADRFMEHLTLNPNDTITEHQRQKAKEFYDRTPVYWKKYYPDCTLMYVNADHWDYLRHDNNLIPLISYFKSLIKRDC